LAGGGCEQEAAPAPDVSLPLLQLDVATQAALSNVCCGMRYEAQQMTAVKQCLWCSAEFKQALPPHAEQVYCTYRCHLLAKGIEV
jgi:hypothetical protein